MKCYLIFASLCALWRDDIPCLERKIYYVIAYYENNYGVRLRCDGANNLGTRFNTLKWCNQSGYKVQYAEMVQSIWVQGSIR